MSILIVWSRLERAPAAKQGSGWNNVDSFGDLKQLDHIGDHAASPVRIAI